MTEKQVGRLLIGRGVTISVGEPWEFTSPDGENVLNGTIVAVSGEGDLSEQKVKIEVTPFKAEHGRTIDHLVARRRYKERSGIIEQIAAGEDAEVNLDYSDQVPQEERDPEISPKLMGGVTLAD